MNESAVIEKPRSKFSWLAVPFVWAFWFTLGLAKMFWFGLVAFMKAIWHFTDNYIKGVNEYTSPVGETTRRKLFRFTPVRYTFRFFLWMFAPIIIVIVPVGLLVVVVAFFVTIDQLTWQKFPVNQQFVEIAQEVNGQRPELKDIGATIFTAAYFQMENELRSSVLGWTVNDSWWIPQFWVYDNKVNRQLGVLHASRELTEVLSIAISKLGSADEEDTRLVAARQQGFAFDPYSWWFPNSEDRYWEGINLIKSYQNDLRAGNIQNATINITNTDLEAILLSIANRVLEVPHGRLNARNFDTPLNELDDRVFFAQGAAIVARDALVAIRYAFEDKVAEAGALANLDQAILSLEGAVEFHPWWIMRGDGDSMFADHRSKMSRYYTDAIQRIKDVADAINR